jgi:hypothetical protein
MKPVYAGGTGLWTPGYPGIDAWLARAPDPAATVPGSAILPPTLRRRSSRLSRAAAEALAQAGRAGGADLGAVPTVWASAYAEIETTIAMLEAMLEPDGLPSPTRFHNSVHNTASGTASIACGNRAFSTSLAAGPETVAMGLLEAMALLEERGGEVVLVAFDEPPPAPFAPAPAWPALAVALHLSSARLPSSRVELRDLARGAAGVSPLPEPFSFHPCAPALRLLEAVASARPQTLGLGLCPEGGWAVQVRALGES